MATIVGKNGQMSANPQIGNLIKIVPFAEAFRNDAHKELSAAAKSAKRGAISQLSRIRVFKSALRTTKTAHRRKAHRVFTRNNKKLKKAA